MRIALMLHVPSSQCLILQFPSNSRDVNCIGTERQKFTFKDSQQTTWKTKLVRSIHCIDVAVQLVSERESGLVGKIGLWTQNAAAVPFTAPRGSGWQPWFHNFSFYCLWRALSFAPFPEASVEWEALKHFHTHVSRWRSRFPNARVFWLCVQKVLIQTDLRWFRSSHWQFTGDR